MESFLHLPTIMVMHTGSTLIATLILGLMWFRRRDSLLLTMLLLASGLGCVSTFLQILRGWLPLGFASGFGLGLAALSLGLVWQAQAVFDGHRPNYFHASVGALLWWVLNLLPLVHESQIMRTVIIAAILGTYSMLSARQVWIGRIAEPLPTRGLATVLHSLRSLMWLSAAPLAVFVSPAYPAPNEFAGWFVLSSLVNTFLVVLTILSVLILAMERAERIHRLASELDPLTNLPNRRNFVTRAETMLRRSEPVALLLFDIDHFKAVNDNHGHAMGDEVLRRFSRVIEQKLEADWLFARIGGEEFACLMPCKTASDAAVVADLLRTETSAIRFPETSLRQVTVSIGVSEKSQTAVGLDQLLAMADAALYRAKSRWTQLRAFL
ncbi:GGDEF domain-containing protein [Peteryoungia desertarenae]|uniref:diguanylate cyclase n=1 Tax=Peteryoungia desertarenae TaxID=1813451 RepID=A0ABX6QN66_9HYPH|nr:GGDEF domain-containing protein [Peteryoungia desertarenae]QLF69978.1 GGDEF domain-containing protein [Peteryoungia desertarenae]